MRLRQFPALAAVLAFPMALMTEPAAASEPRLTIELNALEPQEAACRLYFVAQNEGDADLTALVLEAVIFDGAGRVAALTLLDFRDLPGGRMRVRSFDLPGLDCAVLDRLLINEVATCEWATAGPDCARRLEFATRADVEILQ